MIFEKRSLLSKYRPQTQRTNSTTLEFEPRMLGIGENGGKALF